MVLERDLEITQREFFESVLADLRKAYLDATGSELADDELAAGFRFSADAEGGVSERATEVIRYIPLCELALRSTGPEGATETSYAVEPREEGCHVTFARETAGTCQARGVGGALQEAFYLGRMADHLYDIQNAVLDHREGAEACRVVMPFSGTWRPRGLFAKFIGQNA